MVSYVINQDCPQLLELPAFIYGCNNAALVVSALINSGAIHSLTSKSLFTKITLPLVLGQKPSVILADGSLFTCEEEVNAAYGVILQNDNKVYMLLHSQFMVIENLHQDMILGFDCLQSVKPQANWVNYCVTLKNGFVAAGVPDHCTVKVKLYSF